VNRPEHIAAAIVAATAITLLIGDPYLSRIVAKACIFAMAAIAVELLISQCGLASFGHAAFFAAGGYTAGILALNGVTDALLVWGAAVAVGMLAGIVLGGFCLRTRGLYFLMITLAFGQMTYLGMQGLRQYGGDDGFRLRRGVALPFIGETGPSGMLIVSAIVLIAIVGLSAYLRRARIGALVRAARDQPRRLASLGVDARLYNLVMFTISAAITALAGALNAALVLYVSPELSNWFLSGNLLIMVIFGGIGPLAGPVFGAAAMIGLEEVLAAATERWPFFLGLAVILRVLLWDELKRVAALARA
jgi:branched-chain amino acid transport system permease protein